MKTFIAILIAASFIQATFLPINLVLIILVCRSYIRTDKANLYLAFGFGLLNSHLNLQTLGFQSIIFLILLELTQLLSKSRLAGNPLLIIPISLFGLTFNGTFQSLINHQSAHILPQIFLESLFSLPILYLVKLWEERFVVAKEIKLRF